MKLLLYLILLTFPLPLLYVIIRYKHYVYCLPPFVAFIGIYVFNIIGSIEVIRDERLFSYMYFYSLLIIIVLFYLFYMVVFSFKSKLYIDWRSIHLGHINSIIPLFVMLWAYSFFMFFLYYQRHGLPALFHVSLFQYTDIYALRAKGSTSLPEGMHWYRFAFNTIPSFIFVYTYILKRLKPTRRTRIAFYFNAVLVLVFYSLYLYKAPYIYLILYILLVLFFLKGKNLGIKKMVGYMALGMGTIIVMLRLYLLNRGFMDVLKLTSYFLYRRICIVYTKAHAYMIQIFPDQHDFFYGRTFGNPGHILPYEPVNLSQFLGNWVHGILQNYSAPSFSQGYANFGWLGFILVILVMFFQIILLQIIFKKCPKNPLFLALYVLIIPRMLGYGNQSIQAIIGEILILFSIVLVFAYYFLRDISISLGKGKSVARWRRPLPE